jgi:hypothetical protein
MLAKHTHVLMADRSILSPGRVWLVLASIGLLGAALLVGCGAAGPSQGRHVLRLAAALRQFNVVYAVPDSTGSPLRSLELFRASSGQTVTIGQSEDYTMVHWNPSGSEVAALAMGETSGESDAVDLVNPASGTSQSVALAAATIPTFVSWAPNGIALAVIGAGVELLTPAGQITSSTLVPSPGGAVQPPATGLGGTGYSVSGGGYAWSPNSQVLAAVVGDDLVLESPGAAAQVVNLASLLPGLGSDA